VGTRNEAPYHMVATSGWTLDPQGRAMSKLLGNTVDPVDIANRLGGEIVRLWVASVDFREDVRASEELMQRVAENYKKIRNTFRFILGNLHGFVPHNAVGFDDLEELDKYMILQTAEMTQQVLQWYEAFEFHKVYQRVNQFCVVDLSAFYFDVLKDRLYTYAPESRPRRAAQTAIWRIGETLVRLLAPLMSFTTEEIWQYLPAVKDRASSVHLALFPDPEKLAGDWADPKVAEAARKEWNVLLSVRDEALKALEAARNEKLIGGSLEAALKITAPKPVYEVLARHQADLRYLFIVSAVSLEEAPSGNGAAPVTVLVNKAPGEKCERCWNYSTHVGEDKTYPTVCERCSAALKEIEAGAPAK